MEKLNSLAHSDMRHGARPGGISSGVSETADETKVNRIKHAPHHDGNGCGSVLGGGSCFVTNCNDDIGPQGDEFVHDSRNAFKQPLSVPQVEDEVLAFDVSSAPQLAYKSPPDRSLGSPIVAG
jgi:hypothetical protein